jgi:hypothetical protein
MVIKQVCGENAVPIVVFWVAVPGIAVFVSIVGWKNLMGICWRLPPPRPDLITQVLRQSYIRPELRFPHLQLFNECKDAEAPASKLISQTLLPSHVIIRFEPLIFYNITPNYHISKGEAGI